MTEKTTEQKTVRKINYQKMDELMFYLAPVIGFLLALGFAFTPVWQLSILAGMISGLFYSKMKKGVVAGLLSVGIAWSLYVVIKISISNIETLFNQIGGIILGNENLAWLFIILIILLGFIFGALGGSLGSGIRKLLEMNDNPVDS